MNRPTGLHYPNKKHFSRETHQNNEKSQLAINIPLALQISAVAK